MNGSTTAIAQDIKYGISHEQTAHAHLDIFKNFLNHAPCIKYYFN